MDAIDHAAAVQEKFNEQALADRKPPGHVLRPNLVCNDCGEGNDRPAYAICTQCFQNLQPA